MSKERTWMPLYVSDYLNDTSLLTMEEHGAYCCLMMHYWMLGALPRTDEELAKLLRLNVRSFRRIKPKLLQFFNTDWTHDRIEKELVSARDKYEKRSEAGRKGGLQKSSNAKAKSYQSQSQSHFSSKELKENNLIPMSLKEYWSLDKTEH